MIAIQLDSMEIEQRFPNFLIVDEFTGLVFTIVAVEDGVKYWDYISKDYAAYLQQQKIAS